VRSYSAEHFYIAASPHFEVRSICSR